MIVLDKFRGGRELVPGRELVHHHYIEVACRRWANVGPTVKKLLAQRRQPTSDRRMCRRWANVGPTVECYLGNWYPGMNWSTTTTETAMNIAVVTTTSLFGMQICRSFIDDTQMLINIGSPVLCQVKVCAMIRCQAVTLVLQWPCVLKDNNTLINKTLESTKNLTILQYSTVYSTVVTGVMQYFYALHLRLIICRLTYCHVTSYTTSLYCNMLKCFFSF